MRLSTSKKSPCRPSHPFAGTYQMTLNYEQRELLVFAKSPPTNCLKPGSVCSNRELFRVKSVFVSATTVFLSSRSRKTPLRLKQQSNARTLLTLSTQTRSYPRKKRKQPCFSIQYKTDICSNRNFRGTFEKGAHFAISWWYQKPLLVLLCTLTTTTSCQEKTSYPDLLKQDPPEVLMAYHKPRRARLVRKMPSLSTTKNRTHQTHVPDRSFACRAAVSQNIG